MESTAEESEIMALLNTYSFPNELNAAFGIEFSAAISETSDSNIHGFPIPVNEINFSFSDSHPLLLSTGASLSMDFCMEDVGNVSFEEYGGLNLTMKRKTEELTKEDKSFMMENSKKRSSSSPDAEKTKSVRGRKRKKIEAQDFNGGVSSSSSSNGSATLNSNAKPRANRGSATDPQSLYARKRRERINERLRILQTLVPNGTKVDMSTMLEEAEQYVKFLQHQIKLLSSNDLWMYAPIAYNGKDMDLI